MKSTRTGQTRRPLARIHVIHEALSSGSWPNGSSLADQLEVSTKTILRDLDFMRDEFRRLSSLAGGCAHISWQELDQAFSIQDAGVMQIDVM